MNSTLHSDLVTSSFLLGFLSSPTSKEKNLPFSNAQEKFQELGFEEKLTLNHWQDIREHQKKELENLLPSTTDIYPFLQEFKEKLEYFLLGISLSGYVPETTESLEEENFDSYFYLFEDFFEDLEDYLYDEEATLEEGQEMMDFIHLTWKDFIKFMNK